MVRSVLTLLSLLGMLTFAGSALGGDDWRAAFDEVCGRTSEAMDLSQEELLPLIAACQRVEKSLETQDEAVQKVYLKRVRKCLELFRYVAETKVKVVK
jgi:hypothetical protein